MGNDMNVIAAFYTVIFQNPDTTFLLGLFGEAFNISGKD